MSRLITLSLLVYTACASSEAATPAPAKPQPASSPADDAQALCVQSFTHSRTCTAEYTSRLVDTLRQARSSRRASPSRSSRTAPA